MFAWSCKRGINSIVQLICNARLQQMSFQQQIIFKKKSNSKFVQRRLNIFVHWLDSDGFQFRGYILSGLMPTAHHDRNYISLLQ